MIHLVILALSLLATAAKLVRPSGVRVIVAESLFLKHQMGISNRAPRRAPNVIRSIALFYTVRARAPSVYRNG